jgi:hypothetical protein
MAYVSSGRIDFAQYDLDKQVSDLMIAGGNGCGASFKMRIPRQSG